MDFKNKNVEDFFLEFLPEKENVQLSRGASYLSNFYQELEQDEAFNSDDYPSQRDRLIAMFPGLPVPALDLLELKALEYKSDQRKENVDERIKELTPTVAASEYQEFTIRKWWN